MMGLSLDPRRVRVVTSCILKKGEQIAEEEVIGT